jgi:hypothetical protein
MRTPVMPLIFVFLWSPPVREAATAQQLTFRSAVVAITLGQLVAIHEILAPSAANLSMSTSNTPHMHHLQQV